MLLLQERSSVRDEKVTMAKQQLGTSFDASLGKNRLVSKMNSVIRASLL